MAAQAYLLMQVDAPHADLAMPAGLLEAARDTWLESCKKVLPGRVRLHLLATPKFCKPAAPSLANPFCAALRVADSCGQAGHLRAG